MIPKIIHFCWFGGNPKPEVIEKCIASWKKFCPDWEIKEWNESNYDVTAHPYVKEAYEAKKWAFVSDVARLEIIYKEGGVYLDTDVEILSNLAGICNCDAFYSFETNLYINSGLGFGAIAQHPSVGAMLACYNGRHFIIKGKPDLSPCPAKNTEALRNLYPQFQRNGTAQFFDGVKTLSSGEYNAIALHHATKTWIDGPVAIHVFKDTKLKRWLRKPEHFDFIENNFGKKAMGIYTFLVYDLLEMGPLYYFKRFWRKLRK